MSVLKVYLFIDEIFGENMNATNYYVSTSRVVLQGDPEAAQTWQVRKYDLYIYLSLGNLL